MPDTFERDVSLILEEVSKQGWVIDITSIKWHHCDNIRDGIASLEISPGKESIS